MRQTIRLRTDLGHDWAAGLERTQVGGSCFDNDLLIRGEDVDVFRPDGSLLLALRHQAVPENVCRPAWLPLVRAAVPSHNRGSAAGGRFYPSKQDGTISKTLESVPVLSGIIGYFDRTPPRFKGCRTTAYARDDVEGWADVQPLLRAVNGVFQAGCPERYAAQLAVVRETNPWWIIPGTAFTTVTVNRNFQTAVHKDDGDLREGFGVMAVLSEGSYDGGYLCFPRYRVAVDVRDRDVLLADVHEYHGNTPLVGIEGEYDRISVVCYFREGMIHCGTTAEEYARASGLS
jgi:hypothetical protein